MNKNAIKRFAIEARKKLIASVSDKAGMLGITEDDFQKNPITQGADFAVYRTAAGTEVTLNSRQCHQRELLVKQLESRGYEAVIEEVAYTWFNRICAIRFMEVNDYLPTRVRVLSSEKEGKDEPDLVTQAPDVDLDFTDEEREWIIEAKMNNKLDELFKMLFIKQCNKLHEILPELFEETEDYTEMLLHLSYTNEDDVIHMLVNPDDGIPEADFNVSAVDENGVVTGQVEIIGWLYQYYNTELKDDTFAKLKKNIKITKERIPAATQLFTPDWIVRYMVENSVGRIWIEHLRALDSDVDEKAEAEHFGWKYYLPEAEQEESVNIELAEIRKDYKDLQPTDIKCIDPCMGSGHILIAMFDILMDIYKSVGYSERDAAFDIVENNIHGLDIDQRAYQLAYFAVMTKGRGYNRRFFRGRDDVKPMPKVYAIMESNDIPREHLQFFGKSLGESERNIASGQMEYLLHTFVEAREYGSILNVEECDWGLLEKYVNDLGVEGQYSIESVGSERTQEKLKRLVQIARLLGQKHDAVVTNPPYMGISGGNAKLNEYVKKNYPDSKMDLFAVFIEKCGQMTKKNGYQAMITQHSWMFLSSFEKLRKKILDSKTIVNMAHLGARAFEEIGGEVVQTTSFLVKLSYVAEYKGVYCRLIEPTSQQGKEGMYLSCKNRYQANQDNFEKIPGNPVAYWASEKVFKVYSNFKPLGSICVVKNGMSTTNNNKFVRNWSECDLREIGFGYSGAEFAQNSRKKWFPYNKGGEYRKWYGNIGLVVNWENNGAKIKKAAEGATGGRIVSQEYYFKRSVSWSKVSSGKFALRMFPKGFLFDVAGPSIFSDYNMQRYIMAILNSSLNVVCLQELYPTMNYEMGQVSSFPICIEEDVRPEIVRLVDENIIIEKADWDSFESSWDFKQHPLIQYSNFTVSEIAEDKKKHISDMGKVSDAYENWESVCNCRFQQLKLNEEELNRIFIDIYDLQDELTPEVEDKDVTVRKADLGRDIRSFISYAVGCMFGRYSLAREGLIFAGGQMEEVYQYHSGILDGSFLLDGKFPLDGKAYYYLEDSDYLIDGDNIIPITDEEYFSDDIVTRFVEFVKMVYGEDTLEENLDFIANALNGKGSTSREIIRNYFLKDFYADHLKVYQKRPIYWLFDSGKQNGFKALIYMHRYDADTVGRIRIDYLHQAQNYVETAMKSAQYTIDNAASASEKSKATKAVAKYTKQLAEMQSYDEAIAHIANQRIEIDLDDGVKVNYAKFQGVEVAQEGKKAIKVNLLAKI